MDQASFYFLYILSTEVNLKSINAGVDRPAHADADLGNLQQHMQTERGLHITAERVS